MKHLVTLASSPPQSNLLAALLKRLTSALAISRIAAVAIKALCLTLSLIFAGAVCMAQNTGATLTGRHPQTAARMDSVPRQPSAVSCSRARHHHHLD